MVAATDTTQHILPFLAPRLLSDFVAGTFFLATLFEAFLTLALAAEV